MIQGDGEESSVKGGHSSGTQRKTYWRSASWSSCDSPSSSTDTIKSPFSGAFPAGPLTPRSSHQSSKARSSLPPLQPLFISRRSVDEWPKAGSDDLGEWPHPPTPRTNPSHSNLNLNSGRHHEFQLRKDKLSFFEKECTRIADHIYLGSDAVAKNREILQRNGITHVLNCVGFVCPEYFKKDLVYKTLWLQDNPSEDITSILYDVFDYFEYVRQQGGRVLVHCCQGVSRSTSLVIAYLMWRDGRSFDEAFQFVKSVRATTNPNVGFTCQLLQCQKRVHAAPLSPSSTLRMYRMTPHSPYDPLHLVPKFLTNPGAMALDSRGAFVVRVPSAIYVWIGKHCHPVMAKDANSAAFQVIRYEKAQGPVIMVDEGREMEDFWDAFCGAPLPADDIRQERDGTTTTKLSAKDQVTVAVKLVVGNRRVDAYDLDYEIFQKVVSSGVVPPIGADTELPARENGWGLLRQKFSNGYVKGLIVASRMTECGDPYAKSPIVKDSDSCKEDGPLASFDPSWIPPSPTLSPGSVTSDSYTSLNSSSFSPSLSPSDFSSSSTPSPAASAWSDFTFMPSRSPSPTAPPNKAFPVKNLLEPSAKIVSSRCGGHPLSLAERRGSLSLMLPSLVHPSQASVMRSRSFSLPLSDERKYPNSLGTKSHSLDATDMGHRVQVTATPESERQAESLISEEINLKSSISDKSNAYCTHPSVTDALVKGERFPTPNVPGAVKTDVALFRWPDFQRVEVPGTLPLDSGSVFLLPASSLKQGELKVLYVWVGGGVELDGCDRVNSNDNTDIDEGLYWERLGREFLKRMGLPYDMHVQIIREKDQPEEFLDCLKSIPPYHMGGHR